MEQIPTSAIFMNVVTPCEIDLEVIRFCGGRGMGRQRRRRERKLYNYTRLTSFSRGKIGVSATAKQSQLATSTSLLVAKFILNMMLTADAREVDHREIDICNQTLVHK